MVCNFCSASVATAFVKQYYFILTQYPENLHKFYNEPSLLSWPGPDGVLELVTTLDGINDKIMSSNYKDCPIEVKTTDSQITVDKGVIIVVTGCLSENDNVKKNFSQTFFLAKQERGFYILNDILLFFDVHETTTDSASKSTIGNDQPSPTQNSGPWNINDFQTSSNTKSVVESGTIDCSIPEAEAEDAPVVQPATLPKAISIVAPTTNVKKSSAITTQTSNDAFKFSYASVLAKKTLVASPTTISSSKESNSGGSSVSKIFTPSKRVASNSTTSGQGALNASLCVQAKGIYIGGLPFNITKKEVVHVLKKFGAVTKNPDTIQITRHKDGFCCGFVEFESADSARRAVEAHHVMFGKTEAYITYRRSSYNRASVTSVQHLCRRP